MVKVPAMDLVVDVGNTRTKLGLFTTRGLARFTSIAHADREALLDFLAGHTPAVVAVGSVAAVQVQDPLRLQELAPVLTITSSTPVPIKSRYATPLTLGVDRTANAVGAQRLFPNRPVLAIALGTCIIYDLVNEEGVHLGGAISPGLHMRATAMHAYSARLPLVEPGDVPPLLGESTLGSLAAGVHHGTRFELEGMIAEHRYQYPKLAVVLTGGDALRFASALKSGIFAHPFLTLEGLHAILVHNRDPFGAPLPGRFT